MPPRGGFWGHIRKDRTGTAGMPLMRLPKEVIECRLSRGPPSLKLNAEVKHCFEESSDHNSPHRDRK
jgi:hypothetical protein